MSETGETRTVGENEVTIKWRDVKPSSTAGIGVGKPRNVIVELYKGMEKTKTLSNSLSVSGNHDRIRQQLHGLYGNQYGVGLRDIWTGTFHNLEIVNQHGRFLD